jgi:hypothetical protein
MTDRLLGEHFPRRHGRHGRLLLAAALAGWTGVALFGPTSTVFVSLMSAFLSGATSLNVLNYELPVERHASLTWFSVRLALCAGRLTLTTYLDEAQPA